MFSRVLAINTFNRIILVHISRLLPRLGLLRRMSGHRAINGKHQFGKTKIPTPLNVSTLPRGRAPGRTKTLGPSIDPSIKLLLNRKTFPLKPELS